MKFGVLALDYDGTMARDGRAHPEVVASIREARSRGITVVLVTGRRLRDLQRALGDDDLFDVIVAENGAVLAFPNGRSRVLGEPPSPELLGDLRGQNIECAAGECLIDADAAAAPRILGAVRKRELPLMLAFNRSRVMVLPQGITKATGLREALNTLRLSLHNCIGIGDAENDYPMLQACEIGVAVGWGAESLKRVADHVLAGDGPEALAAYIREVSGTAKLPIQRRDDRRVLLGETATGPLDTAIHGRNILIAGDPRSGKSWLTGLFCEQLLLQGYCLCVIDPEGDYATLETLPGVVVFGGNEPPPRLSDVARALRHPDTSIVIDLSALTHEEKLVYVSELLPTLASLRHEIGLPHWTVVDEAHYFLSEPAAAAAMDSDLAAHLLITYRPSLLHSDLLAAVETVFATPLTDPAEVLALARLCGAEGAAAAWGKIFARLGIEEATRLPRTPADGSTPRRFTIAPRITSHVRHRAKYLDVPMAAEQGFYFTRGGRNLGPPARTLKEFVRMQQRVPLDVLAGHAGRGDFSRWIAKVFGDRPLAAAVREVEERFRKGGVKHLPGAIVEPIRDRYEVTA